MTIGTKWLRAAPAAVMAASALMLLAWSLAGGGETARAADQAVAVTLPNYSPSNVNIDMGDTVTWTWSGHHSVTEDSGSPLFDSDIHSNPNTFQFMFTGNNVVVHYHCNVHPSMHGTITIGIPPANTPTNTPVTPSVTNTPSATATPTNTPTQTPTSSPSATVSPTATTTVPRHEVVVPNAAKNN